MSAAAPIILVGGFGRVGRMVCHHWPGPEPHASRRKGAHSENSFAWSPIEGPKGLLDHLAILGITPKALIMLAGVTPGPGVSELDLSQNAALATACQSAAHVAGIERVLLASSSAVYGVDPKGDPFVETAPANPMSPYGRAKHELELTADVWRDRGLNICALRVGNVAGADALLHPLTNRPDQSPLLIDTFDDGLGPLRSYIGPQTLARVLDRLAKRADPIPDVLNIAAPKPVRMTELAHAANWPYRLTPAPATAHQSITLDCGLLERLIPLTSHDSQPTEMVRQWKATLT